MRISLSRTGRRCGLALVVAATLASGCAAEDVGAAPDVPASAAQAGSAGSGPGRETPQAEVPQTEVPQADAPHAEDVAASPVPGAAPDPAELPPVTETPRIPAAREQVPPAGPLAQPPAAAPPAASGRGPSTAGGVPPANGGGSRAAAAPGQSSGGSGGAFVDQPRSRFTAGNGLSGQYLRYAAGIDPARPVGLLVYVDGTGEYGVDNPTSPYALGGPSGLVATGRARNMITLAVESPDQSCECWHTGDTAGSADFLADLIEDHITSYPIGEVWLAGFSSGAQEITRFLVPRHPELMRLGGGWVVFGGGGPPAGRTGLTAAQLAGVRGHWFTGAADTSVPPTASWGGQAGEQWYAARGVRTSAEWPAGVGHDLDGRLGVVVARVIDSA